ncbi:MAG TPA: Pls/PosA family non-ribosomal peptide synthetase, partial [Polyangiales bacterium]
DELRAVPTGSRVGFTVAQLTALYPVVAAHACSWLTPYVVYAFSVAPGRSGRFALLWSFLTMLAITPCQFAVALAAKWLLLGRVRAGSHRLGSSFHFRFWLASRLLEVAPIERLAGTPLLAGYLRLLGARVGDHVLLWSDSFHAFDLLEIGEGTSVGPDARIRCYCVESGWLHLGPVQIGARCYVGARAVLAPNTRMEDGSSLDELASLSEGKVIEAGDRWVGSPAVLAARQARDDERMRAPLHTPRWPRSTWLLYGLGVVLLPCLQWLALAPGLIVLYGFTAHGAGVGSVLFGAALVAPVYVVSFALLVVVVKWVLLGRVRAGVYPVHGALYVRKWYVDQLMDACLDLLGPLYATLYLNPWYRLLGAHVEPRAELSTAAATCPDLLSLGSECFVADAVSLGVPRYDLGTVTLAQTTVGARAFVGNSAVVPGGTELGAGSLLGVLSLAPQPAELARQANAAWLGAPSFALPARQHASGDFDERTTYQPTPAMYALRLAFEYLRITLPATCVIFLACELLALLMALAARLGVALSLGVLPLLYAAAGSVATLIVVIAKWCLIGRYRASERPLWSSWVFRNELVTSLHENLAEPVFLSWAAGTPLVPLFFRALGAKIGRRVTLQSTWLTEYDLVTIGDDVCLDEDCTLQTHLFEDRVMKMSSVHIDRGASVGMDAVVLYDSWLEPFSTLGPQSLVMKGERLPAATRWEGIPAQRMEPVRLRESGVVST